MNVQYQLHFTRQPALFGKPKVPAVPMRATAGHFDPDSRQCLCADVAAVRNALPTRLRKAFDRATVWYPRSGDIMRPAHAALWDARGKFIGTLYLQPFLASAESRHAH
jgi:hypothetical protein